MPDRRRHRGPHPDDVIFLDERKIVDLKVACRHYVWLLNNGYSEKSSLKLVGDRFRLLERERLAITRCSCRDKELFLRKSKEKHDIQSESLHIDGYNVLTTVEAAIGGGIILEARDGCYRDMASLHGSYRKVEETLPAIEYIGKYLEQYKVNIFWYLDSPISNSGRLKTLLLKISKERGWQWDVILTINPDKLLIEKESLLATADSNILNNCKNWFNLARKVIESNNIKSNIVDLF